MQGYLLRFYTEQKVQYRGKPLSKWLLGVAQQFKIQGATILSALESVGRQGESHSSRFFELADQPIQVELVVEDDRPESREGRGESAPRAGQNGRRLAERTAEGTADGKEGL